MFKQPKQNGAEKKANDLSLSSHSLSEGLGRLGGIVTSQDSTSTTSTEKRGDGAALSDNPVWNAFVGFSDLKRAAIEQHVIEPIERTTGKLPLGARLPFTAFGTATSLISNFDDAKQQQDPYPMRTAVARTAIGNGVDAVIDGIASAAGVAPLSLAAALVASDVAKGVADSARPRILQELSRPGIKEELLSQPALSTVGLSPMDAMDAKLDGLAFAEIAALPSRIRQGTIDYFSGSPAPKAQKPLGDVNPFDFTHTMPELLPLPHDAGSCEKRPFAPTAGFPEFLDPKFNLHYPPLSSWTPQQNLHSASQSFDSISANFRPQSSKGKEEIGVSGTSLFSGTHAPFFAAPSYSSIFGSSSSASSSDFLPGIDHHLGNSAAADKTGGAAPQSKIKSLLPLPIAPTVTMANAPAEFSSSTVRPVTFESTPLSSPVGLGGAVRAKSDSGASAMLGAGLTGVSAGVSIPLSSSALLAAGGVGAAALAAEQGAEAIWAKYKYRNQKICDLSGEKKSEMVGALETQSGQHLSDSQKREVEDLLNSKSRYLADAENRQRHVKRNQHYLGGLFSHTTIKHGKRDREDSLRQAGECDAKIAKILASSTPFSTAFPSLKK